MSKYFFVNGIIGAVLMALAVPSTNLFSAVGIPPEVVKVIGYGLLAIGAAFVVVALRQMLIEQFRTKG